MATAKKSAKPVEVTPEPAKTFDGFRVIALQVENIKKVAFARIRPAGDVVEITGPNGSGKTTMLDSIDYAISGTRNIPAMPIRKGQKSGKITVIMGDFKVTRFFTAVDPEKNAKGHSYISRIEITGKNNETFREPQKMLDSFKSQISFDPLAFTRMKPKEQFETLRGLVKLDVELDVLEAEKQTAYTARRDAGRDVDTLTARLQGMTEPPAELPATPVNTEALTEKLQNAANHNITVAAAKRRKEKHLEDAQTYRESAHDREAQILRLQEQIDVLRGEVNEFIDKAAAEMQAHEVATIPEEIDTAAVALELQNAQAVNGAIGRAVQYNAVKADLADAMKVWGTHDATVKSKDKERADAIARAKMPIEELLIGDGEVLYKGLPFDQASAAEQISVSMALGMAANPKLRVLLIKDGSLLDTKTLAMVTHLAAENGYQIWIERVDTSGKVGVVMEDGEASGAEVEQPK